LEVGFGRRLRAMGRPSGRQHVPLPTTKMGRVPAWIASAVMKLGVKVPLPTSAKDAAHRFSANLLKGTCPAVSLTR